MCSAVIALNPVNQVKQLPDIIGLEFEPRWNLALMFLFLFVCLYKLEKAHPIQRGL